jgi:hypothetical protein
LMDNSIYSALAASLSGKPAPLDSGAVPKGVGFTAAVKLDKEPWARLLTRRDSEEQEQRQRGASKLDPSRNNLRTIGQALYEYEPRGGCRPPPSVARMANPC